MTATGRAATRPATAAGPRLVGPDVVRAAALIGVVVMNFHGFLQLRRETRGDDALGAFFDPWTGPLSTRFAATFVLVAGVGVTLFVRRAMASGDATLVAAKRWTLVRRGLVLYGGGLLFDMIWPATILPYYGAMFVVGAALCTWRTRWVVTVGVGAALAGAVIAWWRVERRLDEHDTTWLTDPGADSPRGLLFDTFVNGSHPLLPWLAFFCAGIVVGRALAQPWWRPVVIAGGATLFGVATMLAAGATGERADLLATVPSSRALPYTASALGTALVVFGVITWLAERWPASPVVRTLADAGAMTLTLYVAHALVFLLVVDELGWIRPTGLDTALAFAAAFWVAAIAAGAVWHRHVGVGPVEWLYRRLGG